MADTRSAGTPVVGLTPRPLTAERFAEFGNIVGPQQLVLTSTEFPFFTNLATLQPEDLPITYINRHHDHQQLFLSLDERPMIVVVAAPSITAAELRPEHIQAFVTDANTALVFHIDTWHIEPRAAGSEPIRALNMQATNTRVHTERIDLPAALGCVLALQPAGGL